MVKLGGIEMSSRLEQFVQSFSWVENKNIPWAQMQKPLCESRIALISTGGIYVFGDEPFSVVSRSDVDESYREIPLHCEADKLRIAHEHYDKRHAAEDLNVVFPLERLRQLAAEGFLGELADVHFSISGYIPKPDKLYQSGLEIAERLKTMRVDAALLVPV